MVYMGCGLLFHHASRQDTTEFNWQKLVGESFFIGVFFIVAMNNAIQFFGFVIQQSIIFNIIAVFAICSIIYYLYKLKIDSLPKFKFEQILQSNKYFVLVIVIIFLHLYYIIEQNQSLPLTPWDAWNGWIAKAKIWYYHGLVEVLVDRANWLLTEENFTNPTAHYPDALPLLYVFNSGFFGWNETALNAIYPAMFIAFLLAFYGNIKLFSNRNHALIAVFILSSIPFVNVHVTLAGYADIWVAALLAISLFNAQHFLSRPSVSRFVVVLIFIFSTVMFKLESWIWLSIFIVVLLLCLMNEAKRKWIYLILFSVSVIWYLFGGFSLDLPFGEVILSPNLIKIPALGTYNLSFVDTTSAWIEALFFSKNWNLLWYSIPFVLFFYYKTENKELIVLPALYLLFTVFFVYVLFYMTYASIFANDFTSSNRIVLHIVPLYIYFVIQVSYQFQTQRSRVDT